MLSDSTPEYWFEIAGHDIDTVSLLIRGNGHVDITIYHMHQAIEKMLKGLILRSNSDITFSHDIERLFRILTSCNNLYLHLEDNIIRLHSFYKNLRYPQSDLLSQDDLVVAIEVYNKLISELK